MAGFRVRIELGDVIDALASHLHGRLHASPDVFVRELLQTAHDAVVKRHGAGGRGAGSVRIHADVAGRRLAFVDDGAGYMVRELRERLRSVRHGGAGFVSVLVVAERVEVLTRSAGRPAVLLVVDASGAAEVRRAERPRVGTTVTLHLRPEHARYVAADTLAALVRRYADCLPTAVHLGRGAMPVNDMRQLVETPAAPPADAMRAYWATRHPGVRAIALGGLAERFTCVDDAGAERTGTVRGVLAITAERLPGGAAPSLDVYVAGAHVDADARVLLPEWGRFLGGMIRCDTLPLAAARDAIEGAVVRWLGWMAREEPTRFREVLQWHALPILAAAMRPDREALFGAIAEHLPLVTSRGLLTLNECLHAARHDTAEPIAEVGGRAAGAASAAGAAPVELHYVTRAEALEQAALLHGLHGHAPLIVDASEAPVERLLRRGARARPTMLRLVRADVWPAGAFAAPSPDRAAQLAPLLRLLRRDACARVRASRFAPADVPMLLVADGDADALRDIEELAANTMAPRYLREVARAFLTRRPSTMVLHVNADNPTVWRLAAACRRGHPAAAQAARALLRTALLAGDRPRTAAELRALCVDCTGIVDVALGTRPPPAVSASVRRITERRDGAM